MNAFEEIRRAALRLSSSEREVLAVELLDSVTERPGVREEDLKDVLAARLAAIDKGEEELIDGPTVLEELRRTLRRRPRRS